MTEEVDVRIAVFTVRLPQEMHGRLRRIAFEHETSMNALIADAISDYLDRLMARRDDEAVTASIEDYLSRPAHVDLDPYCVTCGGQVGIFQKHGRAWRHFRGQGTEADPTVLYDAGHEVIVDWREPHVGG